MDRVSELSSRVPAAVVSATRNRHPASKKKKKKQTASSTTAQSVVVGHHSNPHHENYAPAFGRKDRHHHYAWVFLTFVGAILALWLLTGIAWRWRIAPLPAKAAIPTDGSPYVFKKEVPQCKTGETYDADVRTCAPTQYSPSAYDMELANTGVSPCTSFFHHVCGRWIDDHENTDRSFSYLYRRNQHTVQTLIQRTPAIRAFYESCRDAGLSGHQKEAHIMTTHFLQRYNDALYRHGDLPATLGRLAQRGVIGSIFSVSIERHPLEDRMIPLFMPDLIEDLTEVAVRSLYHSARDAITGYNAHYDIVHTARVMKVHRALMAHLTRSPRNITNYVTYITRDFRMDQTRFGNLPVWNIIWANPNAWNEYLQANDGSGLRFRADQDVWMIDRPFFTWLMTEGFRSLEIGDWSAYVEFLILHHAHEYAPRLPNNVYVRQWDMQGPLGPGGRLYHRIPRAEGSPVDLDCIAATQHLLPGLVAKAFMETVFTDPARQRMKDDVRNMTRAIIGVFEDIVARNTTWLRASDRDKALEKLRGIIVRVAEPDEWEPEPFGDALRSDSFGHNVDLVRMYRVERNRMAWHKDTPSRLDRSAVSYFAMPLDAVNAYYSPSENTITILAGILEHPFYLPEFDRATKYGILGSIIGHELGHALDPHGLYWGSTGQYLEAGLWSSEGMQVYKHRANAVIRHYELDSDLSRACNWTKAHTYGEWTASEDVADAVGVWLSYLAFRKERGGDRVPVAEEQSFFRSFGQAWCAAYDTPHKCAQITSPDVHALPEMRVDRTLRMMPEFIRVFQCGANSPMSKPLPARLFGA